MPLTLSLRSRAFTASFMCLTMLPGAWIFATAPVSGLGTDVLTGAVQRHYETRFEDSFPMGDTLRHAWNAAKYAALGEVAEGAVLGRGGVLFTAEEFTAPKAHRDFSRALKDAQIRSAEVGAELIPVIVPDKSRMMAEALPRARSAHFEDRYDRLQHAIAQAGLRTVDLRPALRADRSFMVSDTHWSPKGAQSAAASISRLLADDLASDAAFETTRIDTRDFDGDLLAFADTGAWRRWVGPGFERIETFETNGPDTSSLGLFDEVDTPVVLVGTSFSAREDFHFLGFLKSELRADVLSYAKEGQGPFVPMELFLEGNALAETTPQFVIWEIPERYLDTWSQEQ